MSTHFSFSRHVRDIEKTNKSPSISNHSNKSKSTSHSHSNSVSPNPNKHPLTPHKHIQPTIAVNHTKPLTPVTIQPYKPPSTLKISLPHHSPLPKLGQSSRHSYPLNPTTHNSTLLRVPSHGSDLSNSEFSSPLLSSEPSPNPIPHPLTLHRSSNSNPSNKSNTKSTTSPPPQSPQEIQLELESRDDTEHTHVSAYNYPNYSYTNSTYPTNQSPVSTTSTTYYENVTPLYTSYILDQSQSTPVPDFSLALDLVVSPTPIDNKLYQLQIIHTPPQSCSRDTAYNTPTTQSPLNTPYIPDSAYSQAIGLGLDLHISVPKCAKTQKKAKGPQSIRDILGEDKYSYNEYSDSDYSLDSDTNLDIRDRDLLFEEQLLDMGCCCSEDKENESKGKELDKNNNLSVPLPGSQIPSESHQKKDNNNMSFTDKFFRSSAQVRDKNSNKQAGKDNESVEDDYPPIPSDHGKVVTHANTDTYAMNVNFNLKDQTYTKTYNTLEEQKDIVSPIMPGLDKINSLPTEYGKKRPSTSALSSPLHSVRLSVTPQGHLAPIHIMDHSYEDNSVSTTDSKEDQDLRSRDIHTPVEYLKKHHTITRFVSKTSQTSHSNVLSRRKRRKGVSDRHTLTFSKPPIPAHELPQSPKFTEINLDVTKPRDFLHKMLQGNLLFSGVDPEFSNKMVNKVVDLMRAADFAVDEVLMHQGAEGDAFYAVEYGKFDILVRNNETNEYTSVAIAKREDCVGEYALLYNQPRTATLRALEKSRVWGITAQQFSAMRQEIMDWNVERFEKRQEFIHCIPLFQKLEQHELLNMTHACHAEIYEADEYIIPLNDLNTNVYIIMEGTVMVSYDKLQISQHNSHMQSGTITGAVNAQLQLSMSNRQSDEMSSKSAEQIELIGSEKRPGLQLNMKTSSSKDEIVDIQPLQNYSGHSNMNTESNLNVDGLGMTEFGFGNTGQSDIPIMEDITINLGGSERNLNGKISEKGGMGLPLSLSALNSVNSVQSLHNISIVNTGSDRNLMINLGGSERNLGITVGGDKELGAKDYFAQNLFVNQYNEYEEEEIVCARAHTRCKVLKIARDDFVLIMAAMQNEHMYPIFNDSGVINGDGELPDNKHWQNKINDIKLTDLVEKDVLGIGSFGKVTLVENTRNGETYALKCVNKYRVVKTGQEEHIINEKRVLTMLDSPFCVKLYATFKTEKSLYFLTELVLGGELFTVLRYNEKFDKNATRFYAGCVVLALEHLHSMDIIYRDLKPENLLLNSRGYLQLTDFGFAKRRNTTCTLCGTPQYLAPEVIHNWVQSFATDWWALGVLLYEMVVGHPPFEDDENIKMYEKILVHEPAFPQEINSKLRHLIQKLLEKNAYQRLGSGATGARQVKLHPFFRNKLLWNELSEQTLEPPYTPNIKSKFDTGNFDRFSDYESDDCNEENEYETETIDLQSPHFKWADDF